MSLDPFDEDFFKYFFKRFREIEREFQEFEKRFQIDLREFERTPGVKGFKIEIRDTGKGRPEVKVSRFGEPQKIKVEKPAAVLENKRKIVEEKRIRPVKKMLDTNVCKIDRPNEVVITMQAPEVKKEDVDVRIVGSTAEIIARKRTGEAYFCTVEIPSDVVTDEIKKSFKGDILIVTIPRRRL